VKSASLFFSSTTWRRAAVASTARPITAPRNASSGGAASVHSIVCAAISDAQNSNELERVKWRVVGSHDQRSE